MISIHEVFADLDVDYHGPSYYRDNFNPRGLRRPRLSPCDIYLPYSHISIHEVFADLDVIAFVIIVVSIISIHEVFADLDSNVAATTI